MKGLVVERSLPRFAAARLVSSIGGSGTSASVGPLRLTDLDAPVLPGPGWHRVQPLLAGICGSEAFRIASQFGRFVEIACTARPTTASSISTMQPRPCRW